nr:unnamed protein product [Spirometra erinaceieuropaei]
MRANIPEMSMNILRADRPRRTSPDSTRHLPDKPNCCFSDRSLASTTTTVLSTNAEHRRAQPSPITAIFLIPATTFAATTATTAPTPTTDQNSPDDQPTTTLDLTIPISIDADSVLTCLQCDRAFTLRIGLVGHMRLHRTATGAPVSGAPTCTHRIHLYRPHTHTSHGPIWSHEHSRKAAENHRRHDHMTTHSPMNTGTTHTHIQHPTSSQPLM